MRLAHVLAATSLFAAHSAHAQSSFRFEGACQINAPGAERVPFDLDFNMGERVEIPLVQVDGFGVEIVTNVIVAFPLSSVLVVSLSTDMPAPFDVEASAHGVTPGSQLRATFPVRLGQQAACQGSVSRGAGE